MIETKEESKIPEIMPLEPDPRVSPYVTIEQAAFIMQETPETLREWINKGLMFCLRTFPGKPLMIHQSEFDRFRQPWKHIWRLDQRISALHGLLEEFKKKIIGGDTVQDAILNLELIGDRLKAEVEEIQQELGDIRVRISKTEVQPAAITKADVRAIFAEMFCGERSPLPLARVEKLETNLAAIEKTLGVITKELLIHGEIRLKPASPPEHGPFFAHGTGPRKGAKKKRSNKD